MQNFSHVEQPNLEVLEKGYALKGNWRNDFFKNNNPLVLELGCGMGEYSVGLAEKFPEKNFLGIDIKGARIWQGAVEALKKKINNVGFLRIRIDWIEKCFDKKRDFKKSEFVSVLYRSFLICITPSQFFIRFRRIQKSS